MAKTFLLGTMEHMLPVPYPESGMDWNIEGTFEKTDLLSGGQHIYTSPTTYRTYSLSWKGKTPGLQNLIDLYTGLYGKGPFYLQDFNYAGGNILPARWASTYQLRFVTDWCTPRNTPSTVALSGQAATFTNRGAYPVLGELLELPAVPGRDLYFKAWGSGTGGIRISKKDSTTGAWGNIVDYSPSATPTELPIAMTGYSAIRLELMCSSGENLTLDHINLSTDVGADMQPGLGVGKVMFSNTLGGNITSTVIDRIGLAFDLVEIE